MTAPASVAPRPPGGPRGHGDASAEAVRPRRVVGASQRRHAAGTVLLALPLVFLLLMFVIPLAAVVLTGLAPDGRWRTEAAVEVLTSARTWRLLGFTMLQAAVSAAAALLVGLPLAYLVARFRFPGRGALRALVIVPFVLPTVVVGAAFLRLVGPDGLLGIDLSGTLVALVAAHVFLNIGVVVRAVGVRLEQVDRRLEDAARTLGASRFAVLRTVTWPMVRPAVVGSGLIVLLFCFTSFGVVQVLGGGRLRTVEVEIYRATSFDLDLVTAAVLSLLQVGFVVAALLLIARLQPAGSSAAPTVEADHAARTPRTLGGRLLVGGAALAAATLLLLPMLLLAAASLSGPEGPTTAAWRALFTPTGSTAFVDPFAAVLASLGTAAAATLVALLVGGCAVAALARSGRGGRFLTLDAVLLLPLGTSAVTVGLGLFLAFDTPPFDLRGSWVLVAMAQSLVAVPFVVRTILPAVRGFDPRLLQAAQVLGASRWAAMRTVLLPLLRPTILVAAGFAFAVAIGEFGATVFLARLDTPTLPLLIERLLARPGELLVGQAYAAATLLMLIVTVVVLLADRVRTGRGAVL